jgi:hypothetical protein
MLAANLVAAEDRSDVGVAVTGTALARDYAGRRGRASGAGDLRDGRRGGIQLLADVVVVDRGAHDGVE